MIDILTRAGCFIGIILLGFFTKKIGLFKDSDFSVLSKIVLKITLPAVIITNFANKELDPSMFVFALLSILFGSTYILLGFLFNLRRSKDQKAFEILNFPGYNIGCFALPFVQSFLGPAGMIATFLFDIGNGFICLGGAFSIASMVKDGSKFSLMRIVRTLLKSVPFILYLVMPILCLIHVPVPGIITSLAEIVGSANAFLSMLMIGVGFKLAADKTQIGGIVRVLSVRFGFALIFALICYFLLPYSLEVRKALILLVFSPVGTAVPAFTGEMKSDVGLSSAINSISIICSIIFMVLILVLI
jgi:predicted permease